MSSNIKVVRICEWCGKKFTAQTTVTRFCSKRCSEHSYKERMRQKKMALSNQETSLSHQTKHKDKDFLTPTETALFLGVGRTYIYDCINRGQIKVTRIGRKTLISKADILAMSDFLPLRQEKLKSGKLSLYLDFYPPIWNPNIKKMSRREFLGLYLIAEPQDKFEMDYNEAILIKARGIRAQREMAIINEEFGFIDKTKKHADFLAYFEDKAKSKYQKWEIVYKHFCEFTNGRCLVKDVTIGLCNDFRSHLLSLRVKKKKYAKIATNSAAGYWSTFRALLKMAYKEGLLNENINDHLESIDWEEPKINFLEIEEIRKLAATPCKVDVLKRASLFACLTGLRISDVLQLRWDNIEVSPDGGHCMRICTQKTKTQATLPLSEEALSYCGEQSRGLVFKGLSRAHTREPFKSWLKAAGITKKITFHGLRYTYATLLITNGTDIYTVSKMLTHKNVVTTQIYAEVVNQKKRDAANSITLK